MRYAIVVFSNAAHRDNEQTYVVGAFDTADAAFAFAQKQFKFWSVVPLRDPRAV